MSASLRKVVLAAARPAHGVDNPHDPNAIGVVVGGEHVGDIARDRTELYHPFLRWAQAAGWDGVSCRARIMGGFRLDNGEQAHLGIELHHTMPLLVQYDGPAPTIPDIDAGRVNLVGEQHHQEFRDPHRLRGSAHFEHDPIEFIVLAQHTSHGTESSMNLAEQYTGFGMHWASPGQLAAIGSVHSQRAPSGHLLGAVAQA